MSVKSTLTVERLRDLLQYDPNSGDLRWLVDKHHIRAGTLAGFVHNTGYRHIKIDGRAYVAHRLAWLIVHGVWPDDELDHVNGDRSDNRLANLREATSGQNKQNKHRPHRNNKSGYLGVCYVTKSRGWVAQIQVEGRHSRLGPFKTPEEAYAAYLEAKATLHPFGTLSS